MPQDPQIRIRNYFESGGRLTVQTAIRQFNTTELRRIVSRLRKNGVAISARWTSVTTSDGRYQRVKEYYKQVEDTCQISS